MKNEKFETASPASKSSLILVGYGGLEYITITNIPIIRIGESYPRSEIQTHSKINEAVAKALLRKNIIIKGAELSFIRKNLLDFSLVQLSHELGLTFSTIFHWEKDKKRPLHPINELAVRALLVEKLNLRIQLRIRKTSSEQTPISIKISAKNLVKVYDFRSEINYGTDLE